MSPRKRKRSGWLPKIASASPFEVASPLGPSPTAPTTGSHNEVHVGAGRNEVQSPGEWAKSLVLPLASVTGIATVAFPSEPARTLSVPDPSRYFCVGQTNE